MAAALLSSWNVRGGAGQAQLVAACCLCKRRLVCLRCVQCNLDTPGRKLLRCMLDRDLSSTASQLQGKHVRAQALWGRHRPPRHAAGRAEQCRQPASREHAVSP